MKKKKHEIIQFQFIIIFLISTSIKFNMLDKKFPNLQKISTSYLTSASKNKENKIKNTILV